MLPLYIAHDTIVSHRQGRAGAYLGLQAGDLDGQDAAAVAELVEQGHKLGLGPAALADGAEERHALRHGVAGAVHQARDLVGTQTA